MIIKLGAAERTPAQGMLQLEQVIGLSHGTT
jgi:hypothetical protein